MIAAEVRPGCILLSPAPQACRWRVESVAGLYAMCANARTRESLYLPDLFAAGWRIESDRPAPGRSPFPEPRAA